MKQDNSKENSILADRIQYLYVERAIIELRDSSVCIIQGRSRAPVPIASIACLILGPGTTVTHRAMEAAADSGCLIVWSGERMRTWYASGMDENRQSKNTLLQAKYWADPAKHMEVVIRMYEKRFPGIDVKGKPLATIRGLEGFRMKELYKRFAKETGVEWDGRRYDRDDFDSQDPIQKMLTVGNKLLYNVCHAGILALGFSPVFGFVHTGTMRSFVYDIADLYKADIVVPVAFENAAKGLGLESARRDVRRRMQDYGLLKKIGKDLFDLFPGCEAEEGSGALWDVNGSVEAGVNYAGNVGL